MPRNKPIICPECGKNNPTWKVLAQHILQKHRWLQFAAGWSRDELGNLQLIVCRCGESVSCSEKPPRITFDNFAIKQLAEHLKTVGREELETHYLLAKLGACHDR